MARYKVSALHQTHLALGARWVEDGEWRLPGDYGDPEAEAQRVRQSVGLQDVSAIGKLDVKGRDAERLIAAVASWDGVSALRLRPDHFLLLTAPGREQDVAETLRRQLLSQSPGCAHVTDVTPALSALALVGPRARDVLAKLIALDLRPDRFPDGTSAQGGLAKIHAVVLRKDWGGLTAFFLLVPRELGEHAWETLREAGEELGLVPFGLAAARLLRGGI
jgi:heterotetrameric sarcosine oxidase gamma subunit